MAADRWKKIEETFEQVSSLPLEERAAFLDSACAGDDDIRAEVESLLAFDAKGDTNIVQALGRGAARAAAANSEEQGQLLGPYRLLQPIGEGGMGTVWLAERADDEFRKQVAIKLIKRGMDTAQLLERFRHERQVLARLEHPNIVRLLDGGSTPAGRPFLVMEYVDGLPLLRFLAAHPRTVREKIRLFLPVCHAVDYAHRQMIVHRDLKPSNILVTAAGEPKLLDFGIAKLIDDTRRERTSTMMRVLTPEYASPEQVRGEPVTAASDVYSLGVILYEILAGARPYEFKTYTPLEVDQVVCQTETRSPRVGEEIDNILLMALRKEPDRRYRSVAEFIDDLERYLDNRTVRAQADTRTYRVRKFLVRNRWAVTATAAVALSLLGGVAATLHQAQKAQRRFQQVRQLANTFLLKFDEKLQFVAGTTEARELLVQTALQYLDGLAAEAGSDTELSAELAAAYAKVGQIQGYPGSPNLGRLPEARISYARAAELYEKAAANTNNPELLQRLSVVYTSGARVAGADADFAASEALLRKAKALAEKIPPAREKERALAVVTYAATWTDLKLNDDNAAAALAPALEGMAAARLLVRLDPGPGSERNLSLSMIRLGRVYAETGKPNEAAQVFTECIRVREALLQRSPRNAALRRDLAVAYHRLSEILHGAAHPSLGRPAESAAADRHVIALIEPMQRLDEQNVDLRIDLARAYSRLALADGSVSAAERARAFADGLAAGNRRKPDVMVEVYLASAVSARRAGQTGEAGRWARLGLAAEAAIPGGNRCKQPLTWLLADLAAPAEAKTLRESVLEWARTYAKARPADPTAAWWLARAQQEFAKSGAPR